MPSASNLPAIRFKGFSDPWEQRKLGELCSFSKGLGYSKGDLREAGTPIILYGRLYTNYQIRIDSVNTFAKAVNGSVYSRGDEVIVPASGETAEDIAVASSVGLSGVLFGGDLNVLVPKPMLDSSFLAMSLSHGKSHDQLATKAQGKSIVHIHNEDIADCDFSYPGIKEQRAIASTILSIDNLITLHQHKHDKLIIFKRSMLDKMFPKDGADVPEIRFAGFSDLWEQRKLGDITSIFSAARVHKDEWRTEGIPFYRSSDVMAAFNGTDNEKVFISEKLYEELRVRTGSPEQGDVMVTGGGSVGTPYIVPDNEALYTKDADLIWVKHCAELDPEYLFYYFVSPIFRRHIDSISHVGTIAHYTIEQVKETNITLPSSLAEQVEVGSFFSSFDNLIALHQRQLDLLKKIKESCLEKMFV